MMNGLFSRINGYLAIALYTIGCAPGIDDSYYGTLKLGDACSFDLECEEPLTCLDGTCVSVGDFPRQWGSDVTDVAYGIAVDQADNLFIAGSTDGSLGSGINLGEADAFLTKISPDGTILWHEQFGGPGIDGAGVVDIGQSGHIYVGGVITDGPLNSFLAKYTPSREQLWIRYWGKAQYNRTVSLAIDQDENIYLAGCAGCPNVSINTIYPKETSDSEAYLLKYSPNGELLWEQTWGYHDDDRASEVRIDQQQNAVVSGVYGMNVSKTTGRGPRWNSFIAKFSPAGAELLYEEWKETAAQQNNAARSVAISNTGDIFTVSSIGDEVTGNTVLIRWSADGQTTRSEIFGGFWLEWPFDLLITNDQRVVFTGSSGSHLGGQTNQGLADAYLVEYTTDLQYQGVQMWGTTAWDNAFSMVENSLGELFFTGNTLGKLADTANQGGFDAFVFQIP